MCILFDTQQLSVQELVLPIPTAEQAALMHRILDILSPPVTAGLPPYFQSVVSIDTAEQWLNRILADGRLLKGTSKSAGVDSG